MQARDQTFACGRAGEISLGDDQPVGEDHLLASFRRPFERCDARDGIDDRRNQFDMELAAQRAVGRESLQYRSRIGETTGLDDDTAEVRHGAALALRDESAQRDLKIGARRAAEAAVAEEHRGVGASPHQRVVDADGAELVDDDGCAAPFRGAEKPLKQRCLPGAEKAGEYRHRQARPAGMFLPKAERAVGGRAKY